MFVYLLSWLLSLGVPVPEVPVSLSGSPQSMERQHRVAELTELRFLRTPAELRSALADGELVRVRAGGGLALKHPSDAAARPEMAHFLELFAGELRPECSEGVVVTSLTRPKNRQPRNAHPLSVHPAGMAVDLRVPRSARCRRALERHLLSLEELGVLDATRERRPAHYHVALFPAPYLAHLEADRIRTPEIATATAPADGDRLPLPEP